jgi:hypothetical protein
MVLCATYYGEKRGVVKLLYTNAVESALRVARSWTVLITKSTGLKTDWWDTN